MRQFVADACHELRTPLTSIRGFAEFYRQDAATPTTDAADAADRGRGRPDGPARRGPAAARPAGPAAAAGAAPGRPAALAADAVHDARVLAPDRDDRAGRSRATRPLDRLRRRGTAAPGRRQPDDQRARPTPRPGTADHRTRPAAGDGDGRSSRSPTTGPASPPSRPSGSSSASTAPTRPAGGRRRQRPRPGDRGALVEAHGGDGGRGVRRPARARRSASPSRSPPRPADGQAHGWLWAAAGDRSRGPARPLPRDAATRRCHETLPGPNPAEIQIVRHRKWR